MKEKDPEVRKAKEFKHLLRRAQEALESGKPLTRQQQRAVTRYGPAALANPDDAEQRRVDRREPRSEQDTERILREMGIADRRRTQRRKR